MLRHSTQIYTVHPHLLFDTLTSYNLIEKSTQGELLQPPPRLFDTDEYTSAMICLLSTL